MCVGIQTETKKKHSYSSLHIPKVEVSRGKMKRAGCCSAGVAFSHDFYTTLSPGSAQTAIRFDDSIDSLLLYMTLSHAIVFG
jgi:hypothetical protein